MGSVYRARDSVTGLPVAVKVVTRARRGTVLRFDRERRLLASLGAQAGFVPLIDEGESEEGPWLVMPLLAGGTLRDKIERGPLPLDEAIAIAGAVAYAIGQAHEAGIVHRDLKPENILFTPDGRPLVGDLGLAKHFEADLASSQSAGLSHTGQWSGSLGYVAPEQIRDAKNAGPEADVWSLGAIIFEMLAGHPPFQTDNPVEMLVATSRSAIPAVRERRPDAPAWLEAIIRRAIAAQPEDRFPDGASLARSLAEGGEAGGSRRAPLGAALLAVAGVLATTGLVAWTARRDDDAGLATAATSGPVTPSAAVASTSAERPESTAAGGDAAEPPARSIPAELRPIARSGPLTLEAALGDGRTWKHDAMVNMASIAADGSRAATSSVDGRIVVRDLREHRNIYDARAGNSVDLADDGRRIVVGSAFGTVEVIEVDSGKSTFRARVLDGAVTTVNWLPDGRVAVGSKRGHLVVIDPARPLASPIALDADPLSSIYWVTVSADGRRIFAGGREGRCRLWDVPARTLVADIQVGKRMSWAIVSPDGTRGLLAGELSPELILIDVTSRRELARTTLPGGARGSVWLPDGRRILLAGSDGVGWLWDTETGAMKRHLEGHRSGWISAIDVSKDGTVAVSGGNDTTGRVWDVATGAELSAGPEMIGSVGDLALSADGATLATVTGDGALRILDAATLEQRHRLEAFQGQPQLVTLSADGSRVAASTRRGPIIRWQVDGAVGRIHPPSGAFVTAVRFIAGRGDPLLFAAGPSSGPGSLYIHRREDRGAIKGAHEHPAPILRILAVDPTGARAVTAAERGGMVVWDLTARAPAPQTFGNAGTVITDAAASVATQRTIFARAEDVIGFTGIDSPARPHALGEGIRARRVAISPDGELVAAADVPPGGAVRVLRWTTGEPLATLDLEPLRELVSALALSDDALFIGTSRGRILRYAIDR